ncbi:MAG: radical SAM protein, partial [Lachnospiraceae bacterium]|nr:radical SAM protein [Lachnospiraceae bacterium]
MHHCHLKEGQSGRCRARKNENGKSVPINYGYITSLALDPIEKKPLACFYPGSLILSVGSFGCNLNCAFCQNDSIAMAGQSEVETLLLTPEELARTAYEAKSQGNIGIAFTYNEPLVGYEFVRDTAKLVHGYGMKNVVVTN